ncbi:MAG: glycoside hydrolase family 127 protein [Bryobacteraceae bacterium]
MDPKLWTPREISFHFDGFIGDRLKANLENWELPAPAANPALIEMFYDRDRKPDRKLLPWSGEFIGKYLCSSILSYRILRDPREKATTDGLVRALLASQDDDGYLGPFSRDQRLTGNNWDLWGHYWAIRALLLYNEEFGSIEAVRAATRAADLVVSKFLNRDFRFTNDGSYGQMNYAIIHAFTKLYRLTGKPAYLEMARWIVGRWEEPGAGLYITKALQGRDMYEFPGNRWESVHDFQGMYEMYLLTGENKFIDAFTNIWYSIEKGDRHNTGGFTSGERTTGDPYQPGAIETCCTVAWLDMSIDFLKLTANPQIADEIELSTFNGNVGGQSPSGRWWTYNTPMNGTKEASAHTINFQCRAGSPELNCCSVNGPRGLAMVSEWAILRSKTGLALNYYGPAAFETQTPGKHKIELREETEYPRDGRIRIDVNTEEPEKFALELRIPSWSQQTTVAINGKPESGTRAGTYLALDRTWSKGDQIEINVDMSPHYWVGDRETFGKTSAYIGPILLAFDPAYNSMDPAAIPEMDARQFKLKPARTGKSIQPWVLRSVTATNGQEVVLCDFATAGAYGDEYLSWLPIRNVTPISFERTRLIWNNRGQ